MQLKNKMDLIIGVTNGIESTVNTNKPRNKNNVGRRGKEGAILRAMADKKRQETWTLKPSEDLQKAIEEAMAATGTPRQQLIFECIRRELPGVVRQIAQERKEALKTFEDGTGEKGRK